MQHPNKPPRGAEMGSVTSFVDKDAKTELEYENQPTHTLPEFPVPNNPAYIGLQLSAGMSTMHARQKLSATAWITIPVENTDDDISDGYDRCMTILEDEVNRRLDEASTKFFPNLSLEDK